MYGYKKNKKGDMTLMTFYLKKHFPAEAVYVIYDNLLSAIVQAFQE